MNATCLGFQMPRSHEEYQADLNDCRPIRDLSGMSHAQPVPYVI